MKTSELLPGPIENPGFPAHLTGVTDARSIRYATWAYDDAGRATSSVLAGGADEYTFVLDNNDMLVTEVDGLASANCVASNSSYTYLDGRVASFTDEEGFVTTYDRDTLGRPIEIVVADGAPEERTVGITWNSNSQITETQEPGLTTTFGYDGSGRLLTVTQTDTTSHSVPYNTNGQQRVWTYAYTTEGLLQTIDGPLNGTGDTITYAYDSDGYLSSVTDELGHVTEILAVDELGRPLEIEDPNGVITQLNYNAQGFLEQTVIDPSGANVVTDITYDAVGLVTGVERADGASLTYTYDNARRLVSVTDANDAVLSYTYDDMGNAIQTQITNASMTVLYSQSALFDELGRIISSIGANSETWEYSYDRVSNLTGEIDPRDGEIDYAYNGLRELISTTDQSDNTIAYARNDQGEIGTYTDPRTIDTTYVYNGWGEVIQETSPDIGTVVYERNALGLMTKRTDARSVVADYVYDDAGRLTSVNYPASPAEDVTYTYDSTANGNLGVGRLTGFTDPVGTTEIVYNSLGEVASEAVTLFGQTATTQYYYDDAGNLASMVYPSGRIVAYWRNGVGEIQSVSHQKTSSDPVLDVAYDIGWQAFGPVRAMTFENGLNLWRVFNQNYRDEQLGLFDSGTPVMRRYYGYLDDLNLTNIWETETTGQDQSYWYSATNELQNADGPWGDDIFYTDGSGNIVWHNSDDGATLVEDQYTYPTSSNRVSGIERDGSPYRSFTYDAAGNILTDTSSGVTTAYTYNNADRLASVARGGSQVGAYTYNARGQLVVREVTNSGSLNGTKVYFYDLEGHVIAEYDALTAEVIREYVWLGDRPIAIIDPGSTDDDAYYVHSDHLNRPIALTDDTGAVVAEYTWRPFGALYTQTGSVEIDLRFPGQMVQEETGLFYNWFRQYDPSIGRYTQPDPRGLVDGPNRYAYVHNDPLQSIDPEGLQRSLPIFGPPGGRLEIPGKQVRFYDGLGNAICDIDLSHDHGAGIPHFHFWRGGVRGPGQQLIP